MGATSTTASSTYTVSFVCGETPRYGNFLEGISYRLNVCNDGSFNATICVPDSTKFISCGPSSTDDLSTQPVVQMPPATTFSTFPMGGLRTAAISSRTCTQQERDIGVCDYQVTVGTEDSVNADGGSIQSQGEAAVVMNATPATRAQRNLVMDASGSHAQARSDTQDFDTDYLTRHKTAMETSGEVVDQDGNKISDFTLAELGECQSTCKQQDTVTTFERRECQAVRTTKDSGCTTFYPLRFVGETLDRYDYTCEATYPASCPPAAPLPGYQCHFWKAPPPPPRPLDPAENPPSTDEQRRQGETYTVFYACIERAGATPKPEFERFEGPTITDKNACITTGQSCSRFDTDIPSQCRQFEFAQYCPKDRVTKCAHPDLVDVLPKPPAGGASDEFQYQLPGQAYTNKNGEICGIQSGNAFPLSWNAEENGPACAKNQNGVCVQHFDEVVCEAKDAPPPGQCETDDGCSLVATECHDGDVQGVCATENQIYQCSRTSTECTLFETTCNQDNPFIWEEKEDGQSWQNAVGAMAAADEMFQDMLRECKEGGNCDARTIKLFNGTAEQCRHQTGASLLDFCKFSNPDTTDPEVLQTLNPCLASLRTNCCDIEINREQNAIIGNKCSTGDVALAGARREDRALNIGGRCSSRINLGFTKICLERAKVWCYWGSTLAMEINKQGREQLRQLTGPGGSTTANINYNRFDGGAEGSWSPSVTLGGGNSVVRVTGWQEPEVCASRFGGSYDQCLPKTSTFLASCTGTKCDSPIPAHPRNGIQDTEWIISELSASDINSSNNLQSYLTASGTCDEDSCAWELSKVHSSSAGKVNGTISIVWPLYDNDTTPEVIKSFKYAVRAAPITGDGPTPATTRISIAEVTDLNSGSTGAYTAFDVQTDGTPFETNHNGVRIVIKGSCDTRSNLCDYTVNVPVSISPKNWNKNGSSSVKRPQQADCSGFTIEEFSLLDLSKMDLSSAVGATFGDEDYSTKLANSMGNAQQQQVAAQEEVTSGRLEAQIESGEVESQQTSDSVAYVYPRSGVPPWTTTLHYAGTWPDNRVDQTAAEGKSMEDRGIRVIQVEVDWGDGRGFENVSVGSRRFNQTSKEFDNGYNQRHDIKVRFSLEDGSVQLVGVTALSSYEGTDQQRQTGGASGGKQTADTSELPAGGADDIPGAP